jgi:hypothetical protein
VRHMPQALLSSNFARDARSALPVPGGLKI